VGRAEPREDLIQGPVAIPLVEEVPGGAPGPIPLGQVTPGGAGPQDPEDRIDDLATAPWGSPGRRGGGEEVLNQIPLVIGELMPRHGDPLHTTAEPLVQKPFGLIRSKGNTTFLTEPRT
jgi:hypothetical protein